MAASGGGGRLDPRDYVASSGGGVRIKWRKIFTTLFGGVVLVYAALWAKLFDGLFTGLAAILDVIGRNTRRVPVRVIDAYTALVDLAFEVSAAALAELGVLAYAAGIVIIIAWFVAIEAIASFVAGVVSS